MIEHKKVNGIDIEIDFTIRLYRKLKSSNEIKEAIKNSIIPKLYAKHEIEVDIPLKLTESFEEIKMDNDKDGSISIKLTGAKYQIKQKIEHEEMNNIIESIVADLEQSFGLIGIGFTMWSCSAI